MASKTTPTSAKKVVFSNLGFVDFAVLASGSVLHFSDGKVKFFGKTFEAVQIAEVP